MAYGMAYIEAGDNSHLQVIPVVEVLPDAKLVNEIVRLNEARERLQLSTIVDYALDMQYGSIEDARILIEDGPIVYNEAQWSMIDEMLDEMGGDNWEMGDNWADRQDAK